MRSPGEPPLAEKDNNIVIRCVLLGCLLGALVTACSSEDAGPAEAGGNVGGVTSATGGTTTTGQTGGSPSGATSDGGGSPSGGATSNGGGSPSGGATSTTGGSPSGGASPTGGEGGNSAGSGAGGDSGGAGASGAGGSLGGAGGGVSGTGGDGGTGGTAVAGSGGACGSGDCGVVTYPTLPGAVESSLYTVTVDGEPLFVEHLTKFSPEMQVHYAHCSLGAGPSEVTVTVNESFTSFTLSPKSRNLATSRDGNSITFDSGPNYLILQVDSKELLFILLDAPESDPPQLGDANVKNIADYGVDDTGATLQTSAIQAAIDAASGAAQNILYFPPGRYRVGELWLRSNMTLYLAGGALLYGSGSTGDFNTGSGGIDIEGCSHGMIRMYQIENTKVLGRGVIDANGLVIRAQNDTKVNLFKIEQSSDILIDGVLVRDPSFWNTLIYRSDQVTIQNYKMINCRPTTTTYNNTDGVNFDESTNGKLYNAFLYTGDDSMATKNEEPSGTVNTSNILHEKVVCYSNSVGCKIGTKTMGQTMDGVVFRDIDVVKAGRALNIDAYDTAVVQNARFENIRIENADASMIALEEADPPDWRDAANESIIKDTYFIDVASDAQNLINLHGRSSSFNITGVHFQNVTVRGNPLTSQSDPDASWSINSYVDNITFDQ